MRALLWDRHGGLGGPVELSIPLAAKIPAEESIAIGMFDRHLFVYFMGTAHSDHMCMILCRKSE